MISRLKPCKLHAGDWGSGSEVLRIHALRSVLGPGSEGSIRWMTDAHMCRIWLESGFFLQARFLWCRRRQTIGTVSPAENPETFKPNITVLSAKRRVLRCLRYHLFNSPGSQSWSRRRLRGSLQIDIHISGYAGRANDYAADVRMDRRQIVHSTAENYGYNNR